MKRLLGLIYFIHLISFSQDHRISNKFLTQHWNAHWIMHPQGSGKDYGVFLLRHSFTLESKPESFIVHVSGDNHYRLYINERFIMEGPARGDLAHYPFETIDLAPFLQSGKNQVAVQLVNFGEYIPWAIFTLKTAFILQGNSSREQIINSGPSWKIIRDEAYTANPVDSKALNTFIVTGPGDKFHAGNHLWDWRASSFDDSKWLSAKAFVTGSPRGVGTDLFWMLVPRTIPLMEYQWEDEASVVRINGISQDVLKAKNAFATIPANKTVSILLDQKNLTIGYPQLRFGKGKGSKITITYAEALFDRANEKGNRNEIEGKEIKGLQDIIIADGGDGRVFSPLWNRTFRYVQLDVQTAEEPLIIHSFKQQFSAYPFSEKGYFKSTDSNLDQIWKTGWRTARLCAGDTYYDCPYYEQLQYVGDTRIQALISLYVSGDDRLMRQAIQQFDDSRFSDGLTQSRYPTNSPQVIPPYSLFWIAMVHDYWMYREDEAFVRKFLHGIREVLHWYDQHVDETGLLGPMSWWNFVDWPNEWPWDNEKRIGGVPPGASDGHSAIISLQYAYALQYAAEMFAHFGEKAESEKYKGSADKILSAVKEKCWDAEKRLYADVPEKTSFSQHTNVMAILTGLTKGNESGELMDRVLTDKSLIQCTFYYRFYLFRAMTKAQRADRYLDELEPWRKMLKAGLTTFAERPDPTRSDCHAWSAAPNFDLLELVAGIKPMAPGFKKVLIEPNPGRLESFEALVPHPRGNLVYSFSRKANRVHIIVTLPDGLTGTLRYGGKTFEISSGKKEFSFAITEK